MKFSKSRIFAVIAVATLTLSACASSPESSEESKERVSSSEQKSTNTTDVAAKETETATESDSTTDSSQSTEANSEQNNDADTSSSGTASSGESTNVNDAILEKIPNKPVPADIPGKPTYAEFNAGVTKLLESTMTGTGEILGAEALALWGNCVSTASYPTLSVEYTKLLASGDVEAVTSFTNLSEADANAFYAAWTGCNVTE